MASASIRVLVAEDYEPFRRFLSSTLQSRTELRVICEVADGLAAIQKARQLQPDLVLLDIGLPTVNGIEAARQIRAVSPKSKILFVSQELSADVVHAALQTGAQGYVCKIDAGGELITALEAILLGRTYLSRRLLKDNLAESSASPMLVNEPKLILNQRSLRNENSRHHVVGFYADGRSLWDARIEFVRAALKNGNASVLIASESHCNEFISGLQAYGVGVSAAIEQGRYIAQDVTEALSSLMVNDLPDPVKFSRLAGELIARAATSVDGNASRVFVSGEATALLYEQGNEAGVVRLEHLWDEMAKDYGIQVHCGYLLSSFQSETGKDTFGRICAEHSAVLSV
jgi:DNA-binding NarL/FixJ family response regulator